MKLLKRTRIFFSKVIIIITSSVVIILTSLFFHLLSLNFMISKTKLISSILLKFSKEVFSLNIIFSLSRRLSKILLISSCLKICLAQKIIFAFFGYDVKIVCGVRNSGDRPFEGHAWLAYNDKLLLEVNEKVDCYVHSFEI